MKNFKKDLNKIINLEHLILWLNLVGSKEISVFYVRKTDYSNVPPVTLAILSNKTWDSISKPLSTLLQLLSGFFILLPIKQDQKDLLNCQARVQVPNPLSQQAPNPDPKVRPSLKNPKTQFFGLGWHNNHMGHPPHSRLLTHHIADCSHPPNNFWAWRSALVTSPYRAWLRLNAF